MKKPKLYTKNEKGRYEEYQIPDLDVSDTLFRRINGKYVPVSVNCTNDLPEGVWIVTSGRSSREVIILKKESYDTRFDNKLCMQWHKNYLDNQG